MALDPTTLGTLASLAGVGGSGFNPILGALTAAGSVVTAREQRKNLDQAKEQLRAVESRDILGEKSPMQRRLEEESRRNLLYQQALADRMESQLPGRYGLEQQAMGTYGDLLSGRAYAPTAEERGRAREFISGQMAEDQRLIDEMLGERLGEIETSFASRGLRGGTEGAFQAGAVGEAAGLLQQRMNAARTREAQMLQDITGQRLGFQAGAAGQMANYGTALQQQAMANRAALQNPALLQQLIREREIERSRIAPGAGYGEAVLGRAMTPSTMGAVVGGLTQAAPYLIPSGGGGDGDGGGESMKMAGMPNSVVPPGSMAT